MISKTKFYVLFNKENSAYNDNNNNDCNGLFVTCCIVETVCSITDVEEFCKNIQDNSALVLRSSVSGYRVRDLSVSGSRPAGIALSSFFFSPSLVNTFAPLKRCKGCSDSLVKIQSNFARLIWIHHYWIWADQSYHQFVWSICKEVT